MKNNVPFRLVGRKKTIIMVPATVNGAGPFEFIFDTGSATSSVFPELAEELSIATTGGEDALGVGSGTASMGRLSTLSVGGAAVSDLDVAIPEGLDAVKSAIGEDIKGTIGINFMRAFAVTIDYPNSVLAFEQPEKKTGGVSFPDRALVVVPAMVNGKGPFGFVVETGSGAVAVSEKLAEILDLKSDESSTALGLGGTSKLKRSEIGSLAVAGAELQDMPVIIADFLTPISNAISEQVDGLLGHPFLKNFVVTIDFVNRRFVLN